MQQSERAFLVIKLADIGDVLTCTPALRALRQTFPNSRLDVLTTVGGAAVLAGNHSVDRMIVADRHSADSPRSLISLAALTAIVRLAGQLRQQQYEVAFLMHHLSTVWGTLKWQVLVRLLRAQSVAGLDNGRGTFLDIRVPDSGFGALHEVEYALSLVKAVGASPVDLSLSLHIPKTALAEAERILAASTRPLVAVHPGSGAYSLARRWPANRFAAVADTLIERRNAEIVLVGGTNDNVDLVAAAMRHRARNLSGRTNLMTLAAVLSRCALFIGNDSGVMHLATATGIPIVAIFGPSNIRAWGPWRPAGPNAAPVVTLVGTCPQGGPCLYTDHTIGRRQGCPERHCLASISPEQVIEVVSSLGIL